MRRVQSESKLPGMVSHRRCGKCGAPLLISDSEHCIHCMPRLSNKARAVGEARRLAREELERVNREIENVKGLMTQICRRLK